jgi:uncharacterized small protein (DUF1192 family)
VDPDLHHNLLPDTTMELIQDLNLRIVSLEEEIARLRSLEAHRHALEEDHAH